MTARRGAAGLTGLVAAVLTVLVAARWGPLLRWDVRTDTAVHRAVLARSWLADAARWGTHLGDPVVVTAATVVVALIALRYAGRRAAVYLLAVRLVSAVFESGLKAAVGRARPVLSHPIDAAHGASFPSGHSLGSAALWASLAVVVVAYRGRRSRVSTLAVALAVAVPVLVAATRVLLGVHFVTDVVGGLCVGWLVALVVAEALPPARWVTPRLTRETPG